MAGFAKSLKWSPFHASGASVALKSMVEQAQSRKHQNREIIIFPEGTRKAPGAKPDYKPGVIKLYENLNIPCVPVALNSGVFWPRDSQKRYKGTIIIQFLPPIPPDLDRKTFKHSLQTSIESATAALCHEGEIKRAKNNKT